MLSLTLDNFETLIEPKILERGADYFKSGSVLKIQKVADGEFSAWVMGSRDYNVLVKLDGTKVVNYECDCPYDWGDICKHVAAVLYHFKNKGVKSAESGLSRELDSLLTNLSNQDLRGYIRNLLSRNRQFRNIFLRDFQSDFYEEDEDFDDEY
ncbi:MAG: SWIM zinc finger family protein [Pyrinomonadaceae bacterium]